MNPLRLSISSFDESETLMDSDEPATHSLPAVARLSILLCFILAMLISIEHASRTMHCHRLATQNVEAGIRSALLIRHRSDARQLLFAGNSLIFDDLSQSDLQQSIGPSFLVHLAGVPGSTYFDWQVGLHALFARGSQPDVLVFSISPTQFLRQPAATPVPVSLLWNTREIFDYRREQHLDLAQFSELLLEHYSNFYELRNTIRIYVRKFIPGYEPMINRWDGAVLNPPLKPGPETKAIYSNKLARLAQECGSHTRLVLMISPTNQIEDDTLEPDLAAAAESLSITVVEPVGEREWPLAKFREDQYHLTPFAAAEFSRLVATDLRQKLSSTPIPASGQ
jgi:hypothetical protein